MHGINIMSASQFSHAVKKSIDTFIFWLIEFQFCIDHMQFLG